MQEQASIGERSAENSSGEIQHGCQNGRDGHIHSGTGDGDDEFLCGFVGDRHHAGYATDGQQGDVGRSDAVASACEGMAEFMQEDAAKQEQNKKHRLRRRSGPGCAPFDESEIRGQQQEGDVNAHIDSRDSRYAVGPLHKN